MENSSIYNSRSGHNYIMPETGTSMSTSQPSLGSGCIPAFSISNVRRNTSINIRKNSLDSSADTYVARKGTWARSAVEEKSFHRTYTSGNRWNAAVMLQRWYRKRCDRFYANRLQGILRVLQMEKRRCLSFADMNSEMAGALKSDWQDVWLAWLDFLLDAAVLNDYSLRRENQVRFYMMKELESTDPQWSERIDEMTRKRQREGCPSLRFLYMLPTELWREEVVHKALSRLSNTIAGVQEIPDEGIHSCKCESEFNAKEAERLESLFQEMKERLLIVLKKKDAEWLMQWLHSCNHPLHEKSSGQGCDKHGNLFHGCATPRFYYRRFTTEKPLYLVLQLVSSFFCVHCQGEGVPTAVKLLHWERKRYILSMASACDSVKEDVEEEIEHHSLPIIPSSNSDPSAETHMLQSGRAKPFDPPAVDCHHDPVFRASQFSPFVPSVCLNTVHEGLKERIPGELAGLLHVHTSSSTPVLLMDGAAPISSEGFAEIDDKADRGLPYLPDKFSHQRSHSNSSNSSVDSFADIDHEENEEVNGESCMFSENADERVRAQLNSAYFSSREKRDLEVLFQIEQHMKFNPIHTKEIIEKTNGVDSLNGEHANEEGIKHFGKLDDDLQLIGFHGLDTKNEDHYTREETLSDSCGVHPVPSFPFPLYCAICELEGVLLPSPIATGSEHVEGSFPFVSSNAENYTEDSKGLEKMNVCSGCRRPVHVECGLRGDVGNFGETYDVNFFYCCFACFSQMKETSIRYNIKD